MKPLKGASAASLSRGYDIFLEKKVLEHNRTEEIIDGVVEGSNNEHYHVHVNINKPRSSTCECEFAKGRHVICKHMVALTLETIPESVIWLLDQWEQAEIRQQLYYEEQEKERIKYVYSLSKDQLREELLTTLDELDYYKDRCW